MRFRTFLLLVASLTMFAIGPVIAQSQRMALRPGAYRIDGNGGGPVSINAFCLDLSRNAPSRTDTLQVLGTGSSRSEVLVDGKRMSLDEAVRRQFVEFGGTGGYEITAKAGPAAANHSIELRIAGGEQLGTVDEAPRDRSLVSRLVKAQGAGAARWNDSTQGNLWANIHLPAFGYQGPDAVKKFQSDFNLSRSGRLDQESKYVLKDLMEWRESLQDSSGALPPDRRGRAMILRTGEGGSGAYTMVPAEGPVFATSRIGSLGERLADLRAAAGSAPDAPTVLMNFDERAGPFADSLVKAMNRRAGIHGAESFVAEPDVQLSSLQIRKVEMVSDKTIAGRGGANAGKPLHVRILRFFTSTGSFLVQLVGSTREAVQRAHAAVIALFPSGSTGPMAPAPTVAMIQERIKTEARARGDDVAVLYAFLDDQPRSEVPVPIVVAAIP